MIRTKEIVSQNKEILSKVIEDPNSTMRALTKNRFYYFFRYFWDQYSEDDLILNWHIEYLCDELQKAAENVAAGKKREFDIIINIPPGSSKTAICSIFFPVWCWVNWHHFRFITASYTQTLALESAEYSREVIRSSKFKELFPEIDIKQDKDTKSNYRVVKREWRHQGRAPRLITGGNRLSTSVGGSATGFHAHFIIWDDPLDPNRAASPTEIDKANHWMDHTLPFRKVDKKVTVTIGIMQRLHQNDCTGYLMKRRKDIFNICLPGEIKTARYREKVKPRELLSKYRFNLLDPNRLDFDTLQKYLTLGQYIYGAQIGQDPIPLGGGMFKVDKITILDHPPIEQLIEKQIRYWDKAGSVNSGAYTVGVKMAKLKDGRFCIMDVRRGRWGAGERETIIKSVAIADATVLDKSLEPQIWIEQEPGSGGKESAEATVKNLAGFSIRADRPTGNKEYRADPFAAQTELGFICMVKAPWNEEYIDELQNFPNSTYKDQVDASSGAFSKLAGRKQVKVGRQ